MGNFSFKHTKKENLTALALIIVKSELSELVEGEIPIVDDTEGKSAYVLTKFEEAMGILSNMYDSIPSENMTNANIRIDSPIVAYKKSKKIGRPDKILY